MASLKFQLILLTILASLCLSSSAAPGGGGGSPALLGGYGDISPTDPDAVANGKYAIEEHNKLAGSNLLYRTVIKAQRQVVAGFNYKLVIEATDGYGGASHGYEAVVWVKDWQNFKQLMSFTKFD